MRLLIWHWGRNGAGPVYAAGLAKAFRDHTTIVPLLSLPENAEIVAGSNPPVVDLPVRTYRGMAGFIARAITAPLRVAPLAKRIKSLRPDLAICAMPAMLDLLMAAALQRAGVRFALIVHDATAHLGEHVPLQHRLQRLLLRRADIVITLTDAVQASLIAQGLTAHKAMIRSALPPLAMRPIAPLQPHDGPLRVLFFGRLLPYKGLDLLAAAWADVMSHASEGTDIEPPIAAPHGLPCMELRIVGQGPESPLLDQLRQLPGVQVENRWVAENELPTLLGWPDAVILPYREASQSGVAATCAAAGRWIVATDVGGLGDQLQDEPRAILCQPDSESLSDALVKLQRNFTTERTGETTGDYATAADKTWRKVVKSLTDALLTLPPPTRANHRNDA
jgi:glycosyltransferase involved in cell wall biosynthesis